MVSSVLTFEGGKSSSNSSSVDNKNLLKSTSASAAHLTSSSSLCNNNNDLTTGTTPSSILTDQISLLFPKCRPRNDVILNNTNRNNSHSNNKNLSNNTEIPSSVITETTQSSVCSSIVHNTNNSNNSNQQSPPTSSLSSSDTSSSTKSPNIGTNPFLSNLSTSQHYENSTHSGNANSNQIGDLKRIMNNDNDNSASYKLAGLQQSNLTIKNMSNQIDGMSKYSQKRLAVQNKQNYHQQQQPSPQQQTHNYYQYNQNPFIKDSERCVWELRNRNTPLNNSLSTSGGGGGGSSITPSSNNPTTPSSTVLNSPDLIEMETKLNFTKQHHSTIKVGRSPVNNHHYTILDHHSTSVESQQQPPTTTINIPSSQSSSHHVILNGSNSGNINNSVLNSNSGTNSGSGVPTVGGIGGKSLNVISDGEVVVFDDIGDNYSNSANNSGSKIIRSESFINNDYNNSLDKKLSTTSPTTIVAPPGINTLYSSPSAGKLAGQHQTPDLYNCSMDTHTTNTNPNKKLEYGDLRNSSGIMEYDGSPRKFGQTQQIDISMYTTNIRNPQQSSSTLFPPRPGFPQRILNNVSPVNQLAHQTYQQQQHQIQSSPHQIPPSPSEIHNIQQNTTYNNQCNTDDTSNDVSEICNSSEFTLSENNKKSTFDYLYEFSETRKVLEEFFKCPSQDDDKTLEKFSDFNGSDVDSLDIHYEFREQHHIPFDKLGGDNGESYIGQRLAKSPDVNNYQESVHSPKQNGYLINNNLNNNNGNNLPTDCRDLTDFDLFLDSASRSSGEIGDNDDILKNNGSRRHSKCFRYSPETTDYDSNCGDLDSEVSLRLIGSEFGLSGEFNNASTYSTVCTKFYTSMPVLEDGLSSGHASDTENNNNQSVSIMLDDNCGDVDVMERSDSSINKEIDTFYKLESPLKRTPIITPVDDRPKEMNDNILQNNNSSCKNIFKNTDPDLESLYSIRKIDMVQLTPPPPAPAPHRKTPIGIDTSTPDIQAALQDIRSTLQRTKTLPTSQQVTPSNNEKLIMPDGVKSPMSTSPIWVPRLREKSDSLDSIEQNPLKNNLSGDEDEADTDLETDRLLGHQRLDDIGFYDEKSSWCDRKPRSLLTSSISKLSPKLPTNANSMIKNGIANGGTTNLTSGSNGVGPNLRQGLNSLLPTTPEISISSLNSPSAGNNVKNSNTLIDLRNSTALSTPEHHVGGGVGNGVASNGGGGGVGGSGGIGCDTTPNKIHSLTSNLDDSPHGSTSSHNDGGGSGGEIKKKTKSKEGSTQLVCEGQPTKSTRMIQAEEAVSRIKSPDGETQPSTEVDLFISTEKIMVLNTDLKEIMMDHALRTISYIADIGDLVVLMARRRFVPSEIDDTGAKPNRTPKMICHVFESEEAQFIAQSIGQAFQVAYMEFLKANGIEDHSFVKEMDYQEVLNSQEIFGDELEIFAKKELQKEVVVPKAKGEILGVVIVESGWGSMLPTVVIANLLSSGAAARCGQLNIGDQIIAINGLSLVGLPLSTCQTYIKNTKNQTVVKFTVVPCAPVVEVKIKRPNTKYQLGFSVQNGVICSLLRGGIAERGGVRVGHRIIEINNQSVVAVPHEKIVNLLATSVGECNESREKNEAEMNATMSTSMLGAQVPLEIRLPKITIEPFRGDYTQWQPFYDLYMKTIHDSSLTAVQKFTYLRGYLRDEAANLIKHFPVTEANYFEAFKKLVDRYGRKRHTIQAFIRTFLDQPSIKQASANSIRRLLDVSDETIRGLKALGAQAESRDVWLLYLMEIKLAPESKVLWAQHTCETDTSTIEQFFKFLLNRSDALEATRSVSKEVHNHSKNTSSFVSTEVNKCWLCSGEHYLSNCDKFKIMTLAERRECVKSKGCCFNCLRTNHAVFKCKAKFRCTICRRKHSTLLHPDDGLEKNSTSINQSKNVNETKPNVFTPTSNQQHTSIYQTVTKANTTILPTVLIRIVDAYGIEHECRALLDSGSMSSFINEKLCNRLGLARRHNRTIVTGIGGSSSQESCGEVRIRLKSRYDESKEIQVVALVLTKLCAQLPNHSFDSNITNYAIFLADPSYN